MGVDVFFVISGFLISTIIFRGMNERMGGTGGGKPFSFIDFYSRRVRRIFPSLIFCLLTFLALGWFVLLPDEFSLFGKHTLGASAYVSNLLLWSEAGDYFQTASQTKPLLHLWSLGIEEQFYLIWPLVLFIAYKLNFNVFTLALVGALASFGFELHSVKGNPTAAFYSPFLRFWELMAGSILAWLKLYKGDMFRGIAERTGPYLSAVLLRNPAKANYGRLCGNILSAIGFALILTAVFALESKDFPGYKALLPVMGAVLMIAAGKDALLNRYLLSNRVMVWFGLISYPLYIWHWPFLSFAWIVGGEMPELKLRIGCVVLAVAMSAVTYYFIEPRLRWGRYGGYKAAGLLSTMIVIGVAGYSIVKHDGYKSRVPEPELNQELISKISYAHTKASANCKAKFTDWNFCSIEKEEGLNTIALLGDSHAAALYDGFLAKESQNDGSVLFSFPCAMPLLGIQSGFGNEWRTKAEGNRYNYKYIEKGFDYVLNDDSIKNVVLTAFPGCFDHGGLSELNDQSLTDKRKILSKAAEKTFRILTNAGKKVLFVMDVPTLASDFRYWDRTKLNKCTNTLGSLGSLDKSLGLRGKLMRLGKADSLEEACTFEQTQSGTYEAHEMLSEIITSEARKFKNVSVIDLSDLLCDSSGICSIQKDGNILYGDAHHMNLNGALFAAPVLLKALQDL